jgi:T5SS/PEP-CTERM-associated repeat protein
VYREDAVKKLMYGLVFAGVMSNPSARAITDVGYEADNEFLTISDPSSTWVTDGIRVGYKGNANRVSIINGAVASLSGNCLIGETDWDFGSPASGNSIEVSGAGSRLTSAGILHVGLGSNAHNNRLVISNGASVVSATANIGVYGCSGNRITVTGAGSQWQVTSAGSSGWSGSGLTVGYRASGNSLVVSNGASVTSVNAHIGYSDGVKYDGDNNHVLVTGAGSAWNSGRLVIGGERATGNRLDILGGAIVSSTDARIDASYEDDSGNNGVVVAGAGSQWILSGSLRLTATDYSTENYVSISDGAEVVAQNGLYIQYDPEYDLGPSRVELNAGGRLTIGTDFDASMAGFMYNTGATLAVQGQLSGLDELQAGRRLETASVLGSLRVHGVFAPGNSPADSLLDGALTLAPDGTLEMELGGYAPGAEHDRLTVTGLSILDGSLDLVFLNAFVPTNGASFDLFNWDGGVSGTFAGISTPLLSGGLEWDLSELYTTGQLNVIPEPGTLSLLGISSAGLLLARRQRRRKLAGSSLVPVRKNKKERLSFDWEVPGAAEPESPSRRQELQAEIMAVVSDAVWQAVRWKQAAARRFWDQLSIFDGRGTAFRKKLVNGFDAFLALIMK